MSLSIPSTNTIPMNSFTTEIPSFAQNVLRGSDKISFEILSGKQKVQVEILPDEEGPVRSGTAKTEFKLNYKLNYSYETVNEKITSLDLTFSVSLTIQTIYSRLTDSPLPSGYGRGTTKDDISNKNISLRFHESQHGHDIIDYVSRLSIPSPASYIHAGTYKSEVEKKVDLFKKKFASYKDTLHRKNLESVDCVGTLPSKKDHPELSSICWPTKPLRGRK